MHKSEMSIADLWRLILFGWRYYLAAILLAAAAAVVASVQIAPVYESRFVVKLCDSACAEVRDNPSGTVLKWRYELGVDANAKIFPRLVKIDFVEKKLSDRMIEFVVEGSSPQQAVEEARKIQEHVLKSLMAPVERRVENLRHGVAFLNEYIESTEDRRNRLTAIIDGSKNDSATWSAIGEIDESQDALNSAVVRKMGFEKELTEIESAKPSILSAAREVSEPVWPNALLIFALASALLFASATIYLVFRSSPLILPSQKSL